MFTPLFPLALCAGGVLMIYLGTRQQRLLVASLAPGISLSAGLGAVLLALYGWTETFAFATALFTCLVVVMAMLIALPCLAMLTKRGRP